MSYLRWLARVACFLYLALATVVLALAWGEGNGDFFSTVAVVSAPLGAGGLYYLGISKSQGNRGRIIRVAGWLAMLAGSVALISFSFVVWPLLLLAVPYSVVRDNRTGP